jgi:hypothetical protein
VTVVAAALVVAACSEVAPEPTGSSPTPDAPPGATARELVIVLPPAAGLAPAEHARVRLLVERVLEAELSPAVRQAVTVVEPADAGSHLDAIERAVRRVGDRGSVCVLGADLRDQLAPLLALYPAARVCLLPTSALDDDPLTTADVDLDVLGRTLGSAARAAARGGTVVVLTGGDAMLDRRWRTGVLETAGSAVGTSALPGAVHTIRTAEELVALLDEQAALIAQGIEPGSPEALDLEGTGLGVDELPPSLALPPVGAVVLDASPEAALLVAVLAERGVRVLAPRSLLLAAEAPEDAVVLRWRVRWDVPLGALVRRLVNGDAGPPATEDVLVLEPGPVYAGP